MVAFFKLIDYFFLIEILDYHHFYEMEKCAIFNKILNKTKTKSILLF